MRVYIQSQGQTPSAASRAINLTAKEFRAAGGEGEIYILSGRAYKLYKDPSRAIPAGKIRAGSEIVIAVFAPYRLGCVMPSHQRAVLLGGDGLVFVRAARVRTLDREFIRTRVCIRRFGELARSSGEPRRGCRY